MRSAYSVEAVRHAEERVMARLPEGVLMQRAAAGLAAACAGLLGRVYGARVVLLVGSGAPERWAVVPAVPKTSVGKFDKKVIRRQY
ncbi:hypothetical protein ACWD6S_29235, partial [Streptomyces zhihengii]